MTPESAREILVNATQDDAGTYTLLRSGEDPGPARITDLRMAMRVLWRHLTCQCGKIC